MNMRSVGSYRRYQGSGGPEIKYRDTQCQSNIGAGLHGSPTQGWAYLLSRSLVEVGQGTQPTQRIGKKITLRKLHIRFRFTPNENYTKPETLRFRLLVVHDSQCNGQITNINDILSYVPLDNHDPFGVEPVSTTAPFDMLFNEMSYINRFKILCDKMFTCDNYNQAVYYRTPDDAGRVENSTSWQSYAFKKSFKLNMPIEFNVAAQNGNLENIRSNNICVWMVADKNRLLDEGQAINGDVWKKSIMGKVQLLTRIRFSDM